MHKLIFIFFLMIPVIGQTKLPENPKERVIKFFNTARHNNMKKLCEEFYHPKIVFKDPVGEIKGLKNMVKYYLGMYENVIDIKFDFHDITSKDNTYMFSWTMYLKSKSLKSGEEVKLEGVSHLKFDQKSNLVVYHRDYFDMGSFIYEHVPILGSLINYIKRRLSGHH